MLMFYVVKDEFTALYEDTFLDDEDTFLDDETNTNPQLTEKFLIKSQFIVNTYCDLMRNFSVNWGLVLASSSRKVSSLDCAMAWS